MLSGSFCYGLLDLIYDSNYSSLIYFSLKLFYPREFVLRTYWLKTWFKLFYFPWNKSNQSVSPCFSGAYTMGRSTWLGPLSFCSVFFWQK